MNYSDLIATLSELHQSAHAGAAKSVNRFLVLRNWLYGAYLVEYAQKGEDRAAYGTGLLERLAKDLRARGVNGLGVSILRLTGRFFELYPQIRQSAVAESGTMGGFQIRQSLITESATLEKGQPVVGGSGLCTDKKESGVDYATAGLDHQLFVSRYLNLLPSEETLQRLIEQDTAVWQQQQATGNYAD